jgi:hypothetical protein
MKRIIFIAGIMCLALVGCGKEDTQEANLDTVIENTDIEESTATTEESPLEYSDNQGTDDYSLWWNLSESDDGTQYIVFNGEDNNVALLELFPDKLPADIQLQVLDLQYVDMRTDIVDGRVLVETKSMDGDETPVLIDVTDVDYASMGFESAERIHVLTDVYHIGLANYQPEWQSEAHDHLVLTGTVKVE